MNAKTTVLCSGYIAIAIEFTVFHDTTNALPSTNLSKALILSMNKWLMWYIFRSDDPPSKWIITLWSMTGQERQQCYQHILQMQMRSCYLLQLARICNIGVVFLLLIHTIRWKKNWWWLQGGWFQRQIHTLEKYFKIFPFNYLILFILFYLCLIIA